MDSNVPNTPSTIKEGKEPEESSEDKSKLDGLFDDDSDTLQRKPQETRVKDREDRETQPPAIVPSSLVTSNFAESAPISVKVTDIPTCIKEYMGKSVVYMGKVSRSLELLSWFGAGICMFMGGGKYYAKDITEAIILIVLAALFANNGIRLPNSVSGDLARRMTRILER